jgi:hypothetical protein
MSKFNEIVKKPRTIIITIIALVVIAFLLKSNQIIPEYPERYNFIVVLAVILWGIVYFLNKCVIFIKSGKWLSTNAVIEECKVVRTDDSDGTTYTPIVTYKYNVGIQEFVSDRIYPQNIFLASSFEAISRKLIDKYYVNQVIKIYYNPAAPSESYVERKGIIPIVTFLFISIFIFILLLLFIIGLIEF